ncbi:MAG: hypothetical protein KIS67_23930 [Verrucomicrobiae bacterium]|nr:hypothetical protein [Verrucomicrobiae bacterium]
MTEAEANVVSAWREAAEDLGFQFTSPFIALALSGQAFEALGLVHRFGGRIGTLISAEPSADLYPPVGDGYGVSYLDSRGYRRYKKELWIEMLCDWGFWGEPSRAPHWYKPGPHCHLSE